MRTVILGVGAQKAGTSWLYKQIAKSDRFRKPFKKEMHILDALYLPESKRFRKRVERRFGQAVVKGQEHYEDLMVTKQMKMLLNPSEYFQYFDDLLDTTNCFSSDITPAYSGLSTDILVNTLEEFNRREIEVRSVLLMREPVSRAESSVRMQMSMRDDEHRLTVEDMMKALRNYVGSKQDQIRSDYRKTVENMRKSFKEDQMLICFYENILQEVEIDKRRKEIERLASHIGVDTKYFDINQKVFQGELKFRYPKEFLAEIREVYSEQYDFAQNELGLEYGKWQDQYERLVDSS